MSPLALVLGVLVLVLAGVVTALSVVVQRRRRATTAAMVSAQAREYGLTQAHQSNLKALEERHAWTLGDLSLKQKAQVAELTGQLDVANNHVKKFTEMQDKLIPQGDRVARNDIVLACRALRLDATVFSGIVFRPTGKDFYAQIDHLIVSGGHVLLVENKYWAGVVVHGTRPDEPAICALLTDAEVEQVSDQGTDGIALRLRRDGAAVEVNVHQSPGSQPRLQASRLRQYLEARDISIRWISTSLYYSHRDATKYLAKKDSKGTALIGDTAALRQWISSELSKPVPPEQPELLRALEAMSLDVTRIERSESA